MVREHQVRNNYEQHIPSTEELTKIFKKHDKNGDGRLSRQELEAAFKDLGAFWPWYRTVRAFSHADADGDGYIDIKKELEAVVNYALECGFTA